MILRGVGTERAGKLTLEQTLVTAICFHPKYLHSPTHSLSLSQIRDLASGRHSGATMDSHVFGETVKKILSQSLLPLSMVAQRVMSLSFPCARPYLRGTLCLVYERC